MKSLRTSVLILIAVACCAASPPAGIVPVKNFDVNRYLGTWYEIARLNHRFERGLDNVTAEYSFREDGLIKVVNRGYYTAKQRWSTAIGKAKFNGDKTVGSLAVSFFGPFYGGYFIVDLDPEYQVALVAGPSRDYLWILARRPAIDDAEYNRLLTKARSLGYNTNNLIRVNHTPPPVAK